MESSPDSRLPVKPFVLLGVSLALVGASKTSQQENSQEPVVKDFHEMNFAEGNQTQGFLESASTSSTTLRPHHALHKYCANITSHMDPKEKVQYGEFKFFVEHGMTRIGSAGIGGNTGQESDWSPKASNGGLVQLGGERLRAEQSYARQHGLSETSLKAQLNYILLELRNGKGAAEDDSRVWKELKSAKTVAEAAVIFSTGYERPGDPQMQNRILYANQTYRKFGHMACLNTDHTGVKARIALPTHSSTS
jgi:Phage tail lysozyme